MIRPPNDATRSLEMLLGQHDDVARAIVDQLVTRLSALDERVRRMERQLQPAAAPQPQPVKRPYPKVRAKYRNPKNPAETWSGRGYKPRWLVALLATGRPIDDFRATPYGVDRRAQAASG